MNKGLLLILSGPSGSGKGTVVSAMKDDPSMAVSISYTTRTMRPNEIDGVNYFFTTQEHFHQMVHQEDLLEHAVYAGNYYGTPRSYVMQHITEGKTVILEIEVYGALQVKQNFPEAVLVFLIPPTKDELRKRLLGRDTESIETINERLAIADQEITKVVDYDYVVVNDTVTQAVTDIQNIIQCEKMRAKNADAILAGFKGETAHA